MLVSPEIPQNTGNIARTCAATGSALNLVEPLGFALDDRRLKRAGLDYWNMVHLRLYPDLKSFLSAHTDARMVFASTKAPQAYTAYTYKPDDYIVFGCETRGLPESLLAEVYDRCVRIPMRSEARSLNLSNAVAVVLYEALRQQGFQDLKREGVLRGREEANAPWLDWV